MIGKKPPRIQKIERRVSKSPNLRDMKDLSKHPKILQNKLNLIPVNLNRVKTIIKKNEELKKKSTKKWRKKTKGFKTKKNQRFP